MTGQPPYHIIEVTNKKLAGTFLTMPVELYKGDLNWIRPLDKDIRDVFDSEKNKLLKQGKVTRWILFDANKKPVGRIAAFVNPKTRDKNKQPTGGVGFFECIHDQEAANLLFNTAEKWLKAQGMEAMDGPINFGERDRWWGCLVDGFEPANYCCNYNPPYYQQLFENYGFQLYFRQFTFRRGVDWPLPEIYRVKADRIARDPLYSFRHIDLGKLEKYADDFLTIYNKAWTKHAGVGSIKKQQAMILFKSLKPVADKHLLWFAYYDNKPVGFFLMLPDLNQIVRHLNGQLNWWGKLKFLFYKLKRETDKAVGIIFGIVPEHQGKGLEGALAERAGTHVQQLNRYKVFEMNWIGDFNPIMIKIAESLGAVPAKTHHTYRKLFDRDAVFERHPTLK